MPWGRAHRRRVLERLGEPGFQELAQLGCRLELRNGIEFLECGSERIRTTRYRPRPEFLVIERCFVEVRRRTRPMVCFVNVESVDRIIYSIFQRFNLEWKTRTLSLFTQAA